MGFNSPGMGSLPSIKDEIFGQ